MTESPKRLRSVEHIITSRLVGFTWLVIKSSVCGQMVIVTRHVSCTFRERVVEFSGRVYLTKQYIIQGIASLLSGIPLYQNGGNIFLYPRHGEGFSRQQDNDNRFSGGMYGLDQFLLRSGQCHVRQVVSFSAGHIGIVSGEGSAGRTNNDNT